MSSNRRKSDWFLSIKINSGLEQPTAMALHDVLQNAAPLPWKPSTLSNEVARSLGDGDERVDRREDPQNDEYLPGCAMVDSCSNILTGDQFYNFLNHNFDRHYEQNRAPLGLYFHAAWLKNNPEFLDAFLYWIDEILSNHNDVLLRDDDPSDPVDPEPRTITESKSFEPWKEKCIVDGPPACWVPHTCKLTSKEVPGETINLQTCVRCPNNYPWVNDPTGDGFF